VAGRLSVQTWAYREFFSLRENEEKIEICTFLLPAFFAAYIMLGVMFTTRSNERRGHNANYAAQLCLGQKIQQATTFWRAEAICEQTKCLLRISSEPRKLFAWQ